MISWWSYTSFFFCWVFPLIYCWCGSCVRGRRGFGWIPNSTAVSHTLPSVILTFPLLYLYMIGRQIQTTLVHDLTWLEITYFLLARGRISNGIKHYYEEQPTILLQINYITAWEKMNKLHHLILQLNGRQGIKISKFARRATINRSRVAVKCRTCKWKLFL